MFISKVILDLPCDTFITAEKSMTACTMFTNSISVIPCDAMLQSQKKSEEIERQMVLTAYCAYLPELIYLIMYMTAKYILYCDLTIAQ